MLAGREAFLQEGRQAEKEREEKEKRKREREEEEERGREREKEKKERKKERKKKKITFERQFYIVNRKVTLQAPSTQIICLQALKNILGLWGYR